MSSTEFNVTDASPRLTRATNLISTTTGATMLMKLRISTYEDFVEPFSVNNTAGSTYSALEGDTTGTGGTLWHMRNLGPTHNQVNLWTDGYTGSFWVALTWDGSNQNCYYKRDGGSFTTATAIAHTGVAANVMGFAGVAAFGTASEGTCQYECMLLYTATLTAREVEDQMSANVRKPLRWANLTFWNDCLDHSTVHVDLSGTGGNFTTTGSPTTSTTDSSAAWDVPLPMLSYAAPASGDSPADASSAPTLTGGATGASLAAGAASSAPTLTGGATGASLAATGASAAPTLSADATGASLKAADASAAPTMNAAATSTAGSDAVSAPTLSAGATGASLAAAASSSAPTLNAAATGARLAAGAASSAPTLNAAAHTCVQNVKFPLALSSDSRYLVTATGVPFRIHADSPWEAPTAISLANYRTYLADRVTRGFNALVMQAVDFEEPECVAASNALPFTLNISGGSWDGDPGLVNFDAALSSPNSTYWDHVEAVVGEACSAGVILLLNPFYLGFNFGDEGAYDTLVNAGNTQAVCLAFGEYLGNRFKNYKNIIWVMGGDMTPTAASEGETRLHKILEGIQSAGDTNLVTCHWAPNTVSTDVSAFAADNDIRAVYEYAGTPDTSPKYPAVRDAYADATVMPSFLFETRYEAEGGPVSALKLREFMWTCQLSSTEGVCFGHGTVWDFDSGWESVLGSTGAVVMTRMSTFLGAINWQQLVPHGLGSIGTLITAGIGTLGNDDYVTAAASPVGTLLVAYEPHAHTGSFTVDRTKMAGSFNARWFDPTDGSYQTVAGGPFPNTGTQSFTNPGNNSLGAGNTDWVLILETPTSGDASSAPTLNAAATSGGMLASSAPTLSAGATGASLWAAAASSAPTLNAAAGGQSNDTPAGGGLWGPDWFASWYPDWDPDYGGGPS